MHCQADGNYQMGYAGYNMTVGISHSPAHNQIKMTLTVKTECVGIFALITCSNSGIGHVGCLDSQDTWDSNTWDLTLRHVGYLDCQDSRHVGYLDIKMWDVLISRHVGCLYNSLDSQTLALGTWGNLTTWGVVTSRHVGCVLTGCLDTNMWGLTYSRTLLTVPTVKFSFTFFVLMFNLIALPATIWEAECTAKRNKLSLKNGVLSYCKTLNYMMHSLKCSGENTRPIERIRDARGKALQPYLFHLKRS
ncbi:hypothetical protein AAMO2058_000498200 [Amorphochlora amoebiformis]